MLASELITELTHIMQEHGNLTIMLAPSHGEESENIIAVSVSGDEVSLIGAFPSTEPVKSADSSPEIAQNIPNDVAEEGAAKE